MEDGTSSPARSAAAALRVSVGLLKRRTREAAADGEVTAPELAALSQIDREGPITIADLARRQQITPQAMGATIASLEASGLVTRSADPGDKRRSLFTLSPGGEEALRSGRSALVDRMTDALERSFTPGEIATLSAAAPLIERLAQLI